MLRIVHFIGAVMLLLTSCSKGGDAIKQQRFTNLLLRVLTVDSLLLKVEVNEEPLIKSAISPFNVSFAAIKYDDPKHRFRITDLNSRQLLLDTIIEYPTKSVTQINFVQTGAGANIIWVGPPVNEPAPPAGKVKISVVYVTNDLPDEVKVVVANSQSGTSDFDYAPTDSILLKKGQFSPYFLGWGSFNKKLKLKVYATDASRTLLAEFNDNLFYNAREGISIYNLEIDRIGRSLVTKLY